ncbi:hypothetical protein MTR67_033835 [Solanum verrucosum]|uniref:Uncharacterized protein n=1 Tax=Solanum verrucosum TaxID=315347 RepID=A0AAF0U6Q6_SOLVR|nr:hypothetical protein MTR67_033835 [Solanum verrucosum]
MSTRMRVRLGTSNGS